MKLIPLSQQGSNKGKYFAQVDDEDYDYLMQWRWSYSYGYAARAVNADEDCVYQSIRMHRFIMNKVKRDQVIDHKDMDKLNNQKDNLRICSLRENQQHTVSRKNSTSKYLGVHFHDRSKEKRTSGWKATIRVNNVPIYLGTFQNETNAAEAYDIAAKKHFKEFASLNFK